MDHAEVLERLDEKFFGRGKIWSLADGSTAEDVALRAHLDGCAPCRREYDALVATAATLAIGAPATLRPPDGAKERMLATVRELGVARIPGGGQPVATGRSFPAEAAADRVRPPAQLRRRGVLAGLAVAAAVLLLVGGAVVGRISGPSTGTAVDEVHQLAALSSSMDRLLADPGYRQLRLRTGGDTDGGTVLVSGDRKELLVVTTALRAPTDDRRYWCFLERDGTRTRLGWMHFADALAYWVGPVQGPADLGRTGDRFVVVLERSDTPELRGSF